MSSKEPRYYVSEHSDINGGWANIGDRESPVYGEPCDNAVGITVYGHVKNGVNTGHKRALEIAEILNGAPAVAAAPAQEAPASLPVPGITLRQYYAGQALAGMLASPECGGSVAGIARSAYAYADAMLAEDAK